ncbi:MAG: TspO/MBR family protein [archaeon]
MNKGKALTLIFFVIACEIIGALGSIFTIPNIPVWYASLTKPFFSPPNWLFAPAWTILFLLMGIALYLIWESKGKKVVRERKIALSWFAIQFALNVLWSFLFFGMQSAFLGFVGIVFLWLSIIITILSFYKVNKKAAYLLIPYILWVSFATVLNYSIMILN